MRLKAIVQLTHFNIIFILFHLYCLPYLVTPARIQALVAESDKAPPTDESHDSHVTEEEEDEGEIHSDDEEMEEGGSGKTEEGSVEHHAVK